jgi:hypothetical protein
MRKALILGLLLLGAIPARGQFTTVTATVIDPNSVPYARCRGEADFVPSPTATLAPTLSGSTFQTSVVISSCDSFGTFTLNLADNNIVSDGHTSSPASKWNFSISSQDGKTSFSCVLTITGTTQNISAAIQACAAPFPASVATASSLLGPGTISGTFSGNHTETGNVTLQGNNAHSGLETFTSLNGVLVVGIASGQYASMQAAHDALPASGGTVFVMGNATPFGAAGTTALAITKPIHLMIDGSNFTYSGSAAQAISCSGTRGVIIEGAGRRGDDSGTAGTTINVTNTASNGISNVCNGATYRDFNLLGPASGTGKGIINTAGRGSYERLNVSSFGSDGWTNDGTSLNANTVAVYKVRSSLNGGNGFVVKGSNGQLVTFTNTDGSANTGDGYNISNQLNVFIGTNADSNTGFDYHFLSGGNFNSGFIFSNNSVAGPPGGIKYEVGGGSNYLFNTSGAGTAIITDLAGTNQTNTLAGVTVFGPQGGMSSGNATLDFILNSGNGSGIKASEIDFRDNGANIFTLAKSTTNGFLLADTVNAMNRFRMNPSGLSSLMSIGATDVQINSETNANSGTGGLSVWTGGASSSKIASITPTGTAGAVTLTAILFANLGTPANGTFYFCSDCTIANPCAGAGTGALAKRLNGVWVCN